MAKQIVMLGPPGAGKGTQAKALSEKLGVPHVSSGDLFRENMRKQTELGINAAAFINRGELVPDDVTIAMVRERIIRPDCAKGVVLDGFPRTAPQAEALDAMLRELDKGQVDTVPCIDVPAEELVRRLTGRRTCRAQGHIFHEMFNPPKNPGICDFDGSELYQREDDSVETVTNRIEVYSKQTRPLIEYYQQRGVLVPINGDQSIEAVFEEIMTALSDA